MASFSEHLFKLGEWFFTNDPTRLLTKLHRNGAANSWAGDRMICLGCYARSVPEGVMSNKEIAELKAKGEALGYSPGMNRIQYVLDAIGSEDHVPKWEDIDYSTYVARNLTKKMYIRGDDTPVGNPKYVRNSFGQMLFHNVCWSTWDSFDSYMIQGQWAGDRFDVVKFISVKDNLSKDGWVDCTEKVKKGVEGLYKVHGFERF